MNGCAMQASVQSGDVEHVQIAVHECGGKAEGSEPAAELLQRGSQAPELAHLLESEPGDRLGIVHERVDLGLQDLQPPVDTTVGEKLVR